MAPPQSGRPSPWTTRARPAPQAEGDGREFALDPFPADFSARIEVIKAPIPDMDGDAIGGTVNRITKSAFDTRRRYLQ